MFKPYSKPKNNIFQFCEDEKYTKIFTITNFERFYIYDRKKTHSVCKETRKIKIALTEDKQD